MPTFMHLAPLGRGAPWRRTHRLWQTLLRVALAVAAILLIEKAAGGGPSVMAFL